MSYFPSLLSLYVIIQMVYEGSKGLKVWNDELPLEGLSQEDYVTANTSRNRNTHANVTQL